MIESNDLLLIKYINCGLQYVRAEILYQLVCTEIDDRKEETTEFAEGTHLLKNTGMKDTSDVIKLLEHDDVKPVTKKSNQSNLHAFTVALALSVHSIFEGLALGLEEETSQVSTNMF